MKKLILVVALVVSLGIMGGTANAWWGCGYGYAYCAPMYCAPVVCKPVYCAPVWCGPAWCGPAWCGPFKFKKMKKGK